MLAELQDLPPLVSEETMQNVSFAVEYAWRAAAEEALQTGSEMIEPIHLLIGLCSIEKFFYLDTPLQLSGYALASIRFEWQDFANRVTAAGSSPSALRQAARAMLPQVAGIKASKRVKMSRSPSSRALFAHAENLSRGANSTVLGVIYLLAAMVEEEGPISALLAAQKIDLPKLRQSVLGPPNSLSSRAVCKACNPAGQKYRFRRTPRCLDPSCFRS